MALNTEHITAKNEAVKMISNFGWYKPTEVDFRLTSILGKKNIQTIVGEKEASVFLEKGKDSYLLQGYYYSEGRNILEPVCFPISIHSTKEQLEKTMVQFCKESEHKISNSYAVKLLDSK